MSLKNPVTPPGIDPVTVRLVAQLLNHYATPGPKVTGLQVTIRGAVGSNMSLKNPVTPPGIDPGTVRLVSQRLNHYATPGPKVTGLQVTIRGAVNFSVAGQPDQVQFFTSSL